MVDEKRPSCMLATAMSEAIERYDVKIDEGDRVYLPSRRLRLCRQSYGSTPAAATAPLLSTPWIDWPKRWVSRWSAHLAISCTEPTRRLYSLRFAPLAAMLSCPVRMLLQTNAA